MSTIDFTELSLKYPNLNKHFKQNKYDFSTNEAVIDLTMATMDYKYKLKTQLPNDRLCPRVPNRVSYIEWLARLVGEPVPSQHVVGLDIGTGASAIYPLLGKKLYNWDFIASEIDPFSVQQAVKNVENNEYGQFIKVIHTSPDEPLIANERYEEYDIGFTMCNPPFYNSYEDLESRMVSKLTKKSTLELKASNSELITPGGEIGFVTRMIEDSLILKSKIKWYTSMVGKLETVERVVEALLANAISNYVVDEIIPGKAGSTKRWLIGWTFLEERPSIPYHHNKHLKKYNPKPTIEFVEKNVDVERVFSLVSRLPFSDLRRDGKQIVLEVTGDVWSRAYRRKMMMEETNSKRQKSDSKYVFVIEVDSRGVRVLWKYGKEYKVYESFTGYMRREINNMNN